MSYDNEEFESPGEEYITARMWEIVFPVLISAIFYTSAYYFIIHFLAEILHIYIQVIIFFVYMFYSLKTIRKNFKEIIIGDRYDMVGRTVNIKIISWQLMSIVLIAFMLLLVHKGAL